MEQVKKKKKKQNRHIKMLLIILNGVLYPVPVCVEMVFQVLIWINVHV